MKDRGLFFADIMLEGIRHGVLDQGKAPLDIMRLTVLVVVDEEILVCFWIMLDVETVIQLCTGRVVGDGIVFFYRESHRLGRILVCQLFYRGKE